MTDIVRQRVEVPEALGGGGIGLLNERPLHASLKTWCARDGDRFEVPVGGYVVDIVRDDLLIEIQTGNFPALKSKLARLVRTHRVRLVYPIVSEMWIVRPSSRGSDQTIRRKSPRRGRWEDVFRGMVSLPHVLLHENLSVQVLMIRMEETRRSEWKRRFRRYRWAVESRRLLSVVDQRSFARAADWRALIPEGMRSFTTSDLAAALDMDRDLAQMMAYCFRVAGMIELIGKRGRGHLYGLAPGWR